MSNEPQHSTENDAPPGFSKWSSWYVALIVTLAVLVALFYALTVSYS